MGSPDGHSWSSVASLITSVFCVYETWIAWFSFILGPAASQRSSAFPWECDGSLNHGETERAFQKTSFYKAAPSLFLFQADEAGFCLLLWRRDARVGLQT